MRYAIYLPTAQEFADVRLLAELSADAERAGWDGVFLWDVISLSLSDEPWPIVDTWIACAAIALATSRIRIGTGVTPLARRRPSKLARETVSVDQLSRGRLVLGVGLGAPPDSEFEALGDDADARVRAEKLDEGLDVLTKLWSGEKVTHRGKHFTVERTTFLPRPAQRPRIPIWVGGWWPNKAPFRRALRWDGFFPVHPDWPDGFLTPADYAQMRDAAAKARPGSAFDLAFTTTFAGDRPAFSTASVREYEVNGVTWWIQGADTVAKMRDTILRGPPT